MPKNRSKKNLFKQCTDNIVHMIKRYEEKKGDSLHITWLSRVNIPNDRANVVNKLSCKYCIHCKKIQKINNFYWDEKEELSKLCLECYKKDLSKEEQSVIDTITEVRNLRAIYILFVKDPDGQGYVARRHEYQN